MDPATRNGDQPHQEQPPRWKPLLSMYRPKELRSMTFDEEGESDAAIDLLWTDALRDMPWDIAFGDTLVVPAEGVRFFRDAGLKFVENELLTKAELTPEEWEAYRTRRSS
jgi:hypothetical protein